MKKLFRFAQFMSYVATIVIAVLLSVIVIKQYVLSPSELTGFRSPPSNGNFQRPPEISPVGRPLPLENINWKENKKTLVLFISTTCRYCTESAPFYQRLVKENRGNVKLVAVFPQPVEEAIEYLSSNSVEIPDVRNASLMSLGLRGTPTLLLVDENGVVSEYWRGKLTPAREANVLSKLSS